MNKHTLTYSIVAGALLLAFHSAIGASVPVPNFSFESPDVPDGTSSPIDPDNWTSFTFRLGGAFTVDPSGPLNANGDGSQQERMLTGGTSFSNAYVTLTSAASLLTIADNTTYTLTVALAADAIGQASSRISLLAGGTPAASTSVFTYATAFADYTTSFTTAPSGDPRVGLPLTVELSERAAGPFEFFGEFDNVRVDASPAAAPEPSTAMMVCVALAAFGVRRRRSAGQ